MMQKLARMDKKYESLRFLFAVADDKIATELKLLLGNFINDYRIYVANTYSSNALRGCAMYADTDYIYFHDCDDYADYEYLNTFCSNMSATDEIICFNVHKYVYDNKGNIVQEYDIFKNKEGEITSICNLPTCVYSKIIPTKYMKEIDFPNLPYTQDWAITYQLFLVAPHRFINYASYFYNNYPTSSSQSVHDTKYRITRVAAYGRIIARKMDAYGKRFEADFLRARYNDAIFDRFIKIGVVVKPYMPSFDLLLHATNRVRLSVLYRTFIKLIIIIKQKL